MKLVIQRSKCSKVIVDDKVVGKIDNGLVVLVGFKNNDTIEQIQKLTKKLVSLRIFDDENHIMNKSILDVQGSVLSISQFTLYADTSKGNRPSYIKALKSEDAKTLYDNFNKRLSKFIKVETGVFGGDMKVSLVNDGPVTIIIEK